METQKISLFRSKKIYYCETLPQNWIVKRREDDFNWLSERLKREYPHLDINLFEGGKEKKIQNYVNYLFSKPSIHKSRFLIFFLSCTNEKKFYAKMDKEHDPKMFKKMRRNFENIMENPAELMDGGTMDPNMSILDQIELDKGRGAGEEKKLKRHIFLEDLRFVNLHNKDFLENGAKVLQELLVLISQVRKKMEELGSVFGELSSSHSEIEDTGMEDLEEIKPKLSKIYKDLKLSFYSWGNIYTHQSKHLKKLFEPCLEKLDTQNNFINEVIFFSPKFF